MTTKPRQWAKQHTIKKSSFEYHGLMWPVQGSHGGLNKRHLERIFQQTDVMLTIFSKITIVRFDLHMEFYSDDNKVMTIFKRRFFKHLITKYSLTKNEVAYFWCREHEKGKGQHYHWAIILDGKKVRSGFPANEIAEKVWGDLGGTIHKAGYHSLIKRDDLKKQQDALNHLSYIAKIRGKGYSRAKVKHFSSSKIKYPNGIEVNYKKGLYNNQKANLL